MFCLFLSSCCIHLLGRVLSLIMRLFHKGGIIYLIVRCSLECELAKEDTLEMLPRILLMYFSMPFLIRPSAPIISGIFVVFLPYNLSVSISRSLYFESFSVIFIGVFLLHQ